MNSWQTIVDLMAQISGVCAGLIMQLKDGEMETLVVSNTPDNIFKAGNRERLDNSGLYCETVVKEDKMLLVPDASKSERWKNSPNLKHGMFCYLGVPIHTPDGRVFGVLSILDHKANQFSQYIITVMEKMRDLIEAHIKLMNLSCYDPLTGLYNRTFFNDIVTKEISRAGRYHIPVTMLILDIDHFKYVNDAFGHLAGDDVLKSIARIIVSALRSSDIVARFGGEEIIVLMPNVKAEDALPAAERIRALLEEGELLPCFKVTASIGVAEYIGEETFDDWFYRADAALYKAKNSGRNQVVVYDKMFKAPAASVCLEWKNEWNSGDEDIDREHRELLELGSKLINISQAGYGNVEIMEQLDMLLAHIITHFENEEKILKQIGYGGYSEHQALHKDLVAKALLLKESCLSNSIKQSAFFSFIVDDVVIEHMQNEDSKFFPYVREYRTSL
jgi:diguanylate cyclase (GGDEF)-like protein/hemerythrin-like metal-binding protein